MRRLTLRTLALLATALGTALSFGACGTPRPPQDARGAAASGVVHPDWSRSATIYEVNIRQYTAEGTLAAARRHLPRLDSLGVDILWLMPVQPIGRLNRKGSLGSYYSIADYTAINPELGGEADFRAYVDEAHRLGMKVILDWVPNHSAHDHEWTRDKSFYVLRTDGSISNARDNEGKETDWTDVAELNYANPAMRRAMIGEMRWWIDRMDVDGFRCDVAGGVPFDFWAEAVPELKRAKPGLFLLAESEDPRMHQWFDMTYGWELHHLLNAVAQGKEGPAKLDEYFAKQARTFPRDAYRMYFTSNHDENSWQGTELERMGANHVPAFVLAATVVNGMPLMYTGQEASLAKRLRFFEKDTVDWSGRSLAPFYRAMLALKHSQPALRNGAEGGEQTRLATTGGERVYAFTRTRGENTVLVAVNFADTAVTTRYASLARPGRYTDWLDRRTETLAEAGTLSIPANGWRVLVR